MPDPAFLQSSLETFLRRALDEETKTRADLKGIALECFSKLNDGSTVVELTIEGGTTRAQINCPPEVLMAAVESVLAATDPASPLAGASEKHKYADFSGGRIET